MYRNKIWYWYKWQLA